MDGLQTLFSPTGVGDLHEETESDDDDEVEERHEEYAAPSGRTRELDPVGNPSLPPDRTRESRPFASPLPSRDDQRPNRETRTVLPLRSVIGRDKENGKKLGNYGVVWFPHGKPSY
jgi:hypothetical protein